MSPLRWSFFSILTLFLLISTSILIAKEHPHVILRAREAGMFSVMDDVLALCKMYDQGKYCGIQVDFQDQGLYYDPEYGENWFNYFFEPINQGNIDHVVEVAGDPPYSRPCETANHTSRGEAYWLIQKYIHPLPFILEVVHHFKHCHFKGKFVIGVHYRGTDKMITEAPFVPHEKVIAEIMNCLKMFHPKRFVIFVATDDQTFLEELKGLWPENICHTNSLRSSNGEAIHLSHESGFDRGTEAMIDMLLLSHSKYLIRTQSNLSRWSTYFNPGVFEILLN